MKMKALQQYLRMKEHYSVNDESLLQKFDQYIQNVKDPINVYLYMQEKSICTYLPKYWIQKAEYLSEQGDYRDAFQCIREAESRTGTTQEENEKMYDFNSKIESMRKKLILQIKNNPSKSKRSVDEFELVSESWQKLAGDQKSKIERLLKLYERSYPHLKNQKQTKLAEILEAKQPSWLYEKEKQYEEKIKKIEEKAVQNSGKNSRKFNHAFSMNTPIKHRDPMRLTKTMDSVQMLKKKKSTNQKRRIIRQTHQEDSNQQNNQEEKAHTVPVGRTLTQLKRRVTFDYNSVRLEKIRKAEERVLNTSSILKTGLSEDSKFNTQSKTTQGKLTEVKLMQDKLQDADKTINQDE